MENTTKYIELLEGGIPEGVEIDHKDTNARNNMRSNLRLATKGQNRANRKMSSATGYRGVYQVGPAFKQQIKQGGTVVYYRRGSMMRRLKNILGNFSS